MYCYPASKTRYNTEDAAVLKAVSLISKQKASILAVYACQYCAGYHLTSQLFRFKNLHTISPKGIDTPNVLDVGTSNASIPYYKYLPQEKELIDLTGRRFGSLIVLGYFGKLNRWVCQCDCGRYCVRKCKNSTIKEENNACDVCRELKRPWHTPWFKIIT